MTTIKTHIAQAIRIFGIMAIVAAFVAAAFPTRSFAANSDMGKLNISVYQSSNTPLTSTQLQPLSGAVIEIFDANGASVASATTDSTTDSGGAISLKLAEGGYKIWVSASGYNAASSSVTVKAGKTTSIKFELRSTSRIQIGGR
ncbi:MAG: carboxypeptidase-like regulatory domain-containing protein [Chloroflexia bacterium]